MPGASQSGEWDGLIKNLDDIQKEHAEAKAREDKAKKAKEAADKAKAEAKAEAARQAQLNWLFPNECG